MFNRTDCQTVWQLTDERCRITDHSDAPVAATSSNTSNNIDIVTCRPAVFHAQAFSKHRRVSRCTNAGVILEYW
jgi:hypothetical protein